MEFHFDFTVSGLNDKQVEDLMDRIVHFVDSLEGKVGGGFVPVSEAEVQDGQENAQ